MKLPGLIRLLRPALVPTAIADVIAGYAFAGGQDIIRLIAACGGSACIYMGGMVLNDLADREKDAYLNPNQPLVQQPGLAPQAWGMVLVLFLLGLALTISAGVALIGATVATLAILYDVAAKKNFPADAVTLGSARAANLALGVGVGGGTWGPYTWTLLLGYGAYIAGITAASRTEDFKSDGNRRKGLALAALPMLIGLGALSSLHASPIYFVPGIGIVVALLHAVRVGSKEAAKGFVLQMLLGIYVIHACALWAGGYAFTGVLMVGLLALSIYLLRLFKPEPDPVDDRT